MKWRGQEIAVKCFDMFQGYKWFERKVRAYEPLKKTYGVNWFPCLTLSRICTVRLLYWGCNWVGILIAATRISPCWSEADLLFSKLVHEHGFEHLDAAWGNVIYIPDGKGKERLVAMDLESHEILGERRSRVACDFQRRTYL